MPTPIELTLSSLLPTVSPLPPELIDLSISLLAQSRSKAATLKPEEEIARTYACCHIACQRLGHRLGLEIATPAPPVKPRVYQKLHAYFNSVLATPKSRKNKAAAVEDGHGRSGETTPTTRKRQAAETATTPPSAVKRVKRNEEIGVPRFVMPMIRHLCRQFDASDAAPHVYAGVQSILYGKEYPSSLKEDSGNLFLESNSGLTKEEMIPSHVVAVFNTVYRKIYSSHRAATKSEKDQHIPTVEALSTYCQENAESLPFRRNEDGEVALVLNPLSDADDGPEAWREMEWYQNIPTRPQQGDDSAPMSIEKPAKTPIRREKRAKIRDPDADEEVGAAGLLPGLGTMFQPAIDWLSDERRAQYGQWRKEIAKQMALTQQKV